MHSLAMVSGGSSHLLGLSFLIGHRRGLALEEADSSVLASCGRFVIGHPRKILVSLLLSSASHEFLLLILSRLLGP